jgi:head-tail adaptor
MKARQFNKRIQLWTTLSVADGFGGFKSEKVPFKSQWANIKTIGSAATVLQGLDFTKSTIQVTVRKNDIINYNSTTLFMVYREREYSITTYPTNKNYTDAYVVFTAVENNPGDTSPSPLLAREIINQYLFRVLNDYPVRGEITDVGCTESFVYEVTGETPPPI